MPVPTLLHQLRALEAPATIPVGASQARRRGYALQTPGVPVEQEDIVELVEIEAERAQVRARFAAAVSEAEARIVLAAPTRTLRLLVGWSTGRVLGDPAEGREFIILRRPIRAPQL